MCSSCTYLALLNQQWLRVIFLKPSLSSSRWVLRHRVRTTNRMWPARSKRTAFTKFLCSSHLSWSHCLFKRNRKCAMVSKLLFFSSLIVFLRLLLLSTHLASLVTDVCIHNGVTSPVHPAGNIWIWLRTTNMKTKPLLLLCSGCSRIGSAVPA